MTEEQALEQYKDQIWKQSHYTYNRLPKPRGGDDIHDCLQVARMAVVCAVRAFDESRGNRLFTYVTAAISNSLCSHLQKMHKQRHGFLLVYDDVDRKRDPYEPSHFRQNPMEPEEDPVPDSSPTEVFQRELTGRQARVYAFIVRRGRPRGLRAALRREFGMTMGEVDRELRALGRKYQATG